MILKVNLKMGLMLKIGFILDMKVKDQTCFNRIEFYCLLELLELHPMF